MSEIRTTGELRRGYYWVQVPEMVLQIAQYDAEIDPDNPWSFTWGSYRRPDRVRAISERLVPPGGKTDTTTVGKIRSAVVDAVQSADRAAELCSCKSESLLIESLTHFLTERLIGDQDG